MDEGSFLLKTSLGPAAANPLKSKRRPAAGREANRRPALLFRDFKEFPLQFAG
jgi:hypothetical protein